MDSCPKCGKKVKVGGLRLHTLQKHHRPRNILRAIKGSNECPVCHTVVKPGGVRLHVLQKHPDTIYKATA